METRPQQCSAGLDRQDSENTLMFLPPSHSEVRDGVVVGLEDLGVVEHLVSERVEPVQGHSDVSGRHPVLQETQQGRTVRDIGPVNQ